MRNPILQMVREALTPRGYEVDIAPTAASGCTPMSEKQYASLFCDWKCPA